MATYKPTREEIEAATPTPYTPEPEKNRIIVPRESATRHLSNVTTVMVGNEKGGVGKTTVAVHLAMGMAARGYRVVLIDGDPQGHASTRSGIKKQPGLYNLLVRDADWSEVLRAVENTRYGFVGEPLPASNLWVLPSNVETRNIANSISEVEVLTQRIDELHGAVDIVLIDTSPTPSLLHGAFYSAVDGIIYPTKLTYTAFDGLRESLRRRTASNIVRENRGLPPISVWGIIPLDFRRNTIEQQDNLTALIKNSNEPVWDAIPQGTLWTETEGRALPVWQLDPSGSATKDALNLLDRFEDEVITRSAEKQG